MKKRILSMLLAIVMVVSALPLLIFTAMAEETDTPTYPETTKEEYNGLYVQEGLVIQYDFFDSNEHWGGDYSNVTDENRLVMQDTNIHSGTETLLPYKQFARGLTTSAYRFGLNGVNTASEIKDYSPSVGNGYLSLPQTDKVASGNGWGAWGRTSGASGGWRNYMMTKEFIEGATFSSEESPAAGTAIVGGTFTLSAQIVSAFSSFDDGSATRKTYQFFLGYTRLRVLTNAETGAFYLFNVLDGAGQNSVSFEKNAANSFAPGQIVDLTQVLQQKSGEGDQANVAQPGLYGIYLNGASIYYSEEHPFYYKADARPGNYHLLWNGGYAAKNYAVRFYNVVLDKADIAQNHFADLAKWFRLDISSYNQYIHLLSDEQKLAAYNRFAELTFDSAREEVQAVADVAFEEALLDDAYFAGFEGVLDAHALAVAKKFSIEISIFNSMPKAFMKKTLAWFASIDLEDATLDKTAVKAAFIRVSEEDIWDYAGNAIPADKAEALAIYNGLYETKGLVLQYDFFDSNKYWGGAYSDGTRAAIVDVDMHGAATAPLINYRVFVNSKTTSVSSARIGQNGMYSTDKGYDYRPQTTIGMGYMAVPTITVSSHISTVAGIGSWARPDKVEGDKVTKYGYMLGVDFIDADQTYTFSQQLIASYSGGFQLGTSYQQFTLNNVGIHLNADENGDYYFMMATDHVGTGSAVGTIEFGEETKKHSFSLGEVVDYTHVISQKTNAEDSSIAMPGTLGIFLDGEKAYYNTNTPFGATAASRAFDCRHVFWNGRYSGNIYAVRYYNTVLDETIIEKNHFADVAKWYKIGLVGWDSLTDGQKKAVYADFADVTVDDPRYTRTDVQALYVKAYTAALREAYAPLMEEYADKAAELAFIKLAAEYLLPIDTLTAVLTSDRDMAYVYANVTAETLAAADDAAALLETAYRIAYDYFVYADGTNDAFLEKAGLLSLDLSKLMQLPKAERAPFYAIDLDTLSQATFNAKLAEAMEKYEEYGVGDPESKYNALYATDINGDGASDLYYAIDFFHSNEYWQAISNADTYIEFPTHPLSRPEFATAESRGGEVDGTYKVNSVFETAFYRYRDTELPNYLAQGMWVGKHKPGAYYGYFKADKLTSDENVRTYAGIIFTNGNGSINLYKNVPGNSYFSLNNAIGESTAETRSAQFVMTPSDGTQYGKAHWLLVNGISLMIDKADDDATTAKLAASTYGNGTANNAYTLPENLPTFSMKDVATFTMATTIPADFQNVKFSLSYNTSPLVTDVAVAYPYTVAVNQNLFNFSQSSTASLYAVRFYNGTLDTNEIMQNNFADLAKFYKLNIYGDLFTTEEGKALLTGEGGLYEKFAAYTIGKADRATLQELINEAAYDLVWKELEKPTDAAYTKMLNAAITAGASVSLVEGIATLPASLRSDIVATINQALEGIEEESLTLAVVAYYLSTTPDAVLNELYKDYVGSGAKTYTHEEYNALYAQKDHLVLWFDFFAAKESDLDDSLLVDGFNLSPEAAPGVIRVGKLSISKYSGYTSAHSYSDGFFRMAAYRDTDQKPGMGLVYLYGDSKISAISNHYYSDYTLEFVATDFEGSTAQVFMLDGVRMTLANSNGLLQYGSWNENGYTFDKTAETKLKFKSSSLFAYGSAKSYSDTLAKGNTIVIRADKNFNSESVRFYKVPKVVAPNETEATYQPGNITVITKEEAMTAAGYTDEAAFLEALAIPATVSESRDANISQILVNEEDKTMVYAVRYASSLTYEGSLNGEAYMSGQMPYCITMAGSGLGGLGSGMNASFYSIRRYDIVLTDAELMQNHFVDLCKYYGIDITTYLKLDEEGRAIVHEAMKSFLVRDEANYEAMMTAYSNALTVAFYNNLKIDGEDAYNAFIDAAAINQLDLSLLLALPESIRVKIGEAEGVAALSVSRPAHIAIGLYNEILRSFLPESDPFYLAAKLVEFTGYSVRVTGSYDAATGPIAGIRSTFAIDTELLGQLIENGQSVIFGASVKNPSNGKSQSVTVYNAGAGENVVGGFTFAGNAYLRMNEKNQPELCYTYTTLYDQVDGTPWGNLLFETRKSVVEEELVYTYFVEIDGKRYEFECESPTFGEGVSSAEVYDYFRSVGDYSANALVNEIVSINKGETESATLYDITVDGTSLADMKLVYDVGFTKEAAEALAEMLYELTGVRVEVIEQGVNYNPASGALSVEDKVNVIWLAADSPAPNHQYADEYLYEEKFGMTALSNHGVFGVLVNDAADLPALTEALRAQLLSMVDEDGCIEIHSYETVTFGTTAE